MRPLSQQGLVHVPLNPRQRGGETLPTGRLDVANERYAADGRRTLHPTKGFRPISERRSVIAALTADMRKGVRVPMNALGLLIRNARKHDQEAQGGQKLNTAEPPNVD